MLIYFNKIGILNLILVALYFLGCTISFCCIVIQGETMALEAFCGVQNRSGWLAKKSRNVDDEFASLEEALARSCSFELPTTFNVSNLLFVILCTGDNRYYYSVRQIEY